MKTKSEFIEQYKRHVAGLALFGYVESNRETTATRAGRVWEIPHETEKLLGEMFEFLSPPPPLTISEHTDAILAWHAEASQDEKKQLVDKLRAAFTKKEEKKT